MIGPHGCQRERWLFIAAVEADRERRRLGLPEPEREERPAKPMGDSVIKVMAERVRAVVQASYFTGG